MKKSFFAVLFVLLALTACQADPKPQPPTELPFNTDPSVLRGGWSGTIFNVPAGQDVALELVNLAAECPDEGDGTCGSYTFEGEVSVGGSEFVPISGNGYAGAGYVYVLTSPLPPTGFEASFELDGATWRLGATYRPYAPYTDPTADGSPAYEGSASIDGTERRSEFRLEPTP